MIRRTSRNTRLLLTVALVALVASCGDDTGDDMDEEAVTCGDAKSATSAIRYGKDHPEVVALTEAQIKSVGELKIGGEGYYTNCSATLVAPKVVLTCGHCLDDPETTYIQFNSGVDYVEPDHTFEAAEWHMHPKYPGGGNGPKYDLGVVLLQEDATKQGLEPLPINTSPQSMVGETIQVVGYGRIEPKVTGNTIRHWGTMDVVDESDLVYAAYTGTTTGICIGDSGGPMLWEVPKMGVHVMAVASTGNSSTCQGQIYYPRTDAYLDWLGSYLELNPCGDETLEGRCDGDTAVWCEGQAIQNQACADTGMTCGLGMDGNLRCRKAGEVVSEECVRIGRQGECTVKGDHEHARWCENGKIRDRNCTACNQICAYAGESLGYYCK